MARREGHLIWLEIDDEVQMDSVIGEVNERPTGNLVPQGSGGVAWARGVLYERDISWYEDARLSIGDLHLQTTGGREIELTPRRRMRLAEPSTRHREENRTRRFKWL